MPKLSIITINKNNSEGLKKTIKSVIEQSSRDFEYIIIDGASTDCSVDVINEYNQGVTCWISEPDTGIYNAMNKGISVAKGEYCQFLNSGDYLVNKYVIEKMLVDISDSSILYGNLIKKSKKETFYNRKIPVESFFTFYTGTLNHSSSIIKRNLFKKYGLYDESLKIVADWKFFLITIGLNNEKVEYRDIDVCYFNLEGISNKEESIVLYEREKVLKELLPVNIFLDYKKYSFSISQMNRINRFKISKWIVWLVERILFKLEQLETKIKKEQIYY